MLHNLNLLAVFGVDVFEDSLEGSIKSAEDLVVVLIDGHLEIETSELGQMTVSVAVLGTENGTDFEDLLEIGSDSHLLTQLW